MDHARGLVECKVHGDVYAAFSINIYCKAMLRILVGTFVPNALLASSYVALLCLCCCAFIALACGLAVRSGCTYNDAVVFVSLSCLNSSFVHQLKLGPLLLRFVVLRRMTSVASFWLTFCVLCVSDVALSLSSRALV